MTWNSAMCSKLLQKKFLILVAVSVHCSGVHGEFGCAAEAVLTDYAS